MSAKDQNLGPIAEGKPNARELGDLASKLADLEEEAVLDLARRRLAQGEDPLGIIEECVQGVWEVGERYSRREYYVSGLIVGGEILREVVELVEPVLQGKSTARSKGTVVLGTAQGDIHDLGKNLLAILLRCHGFTVHDLGVDVAPADFAAALARLRPDIIGISGILTVAFDSMRETIELLRASLPEGRPLPPTIIGGGMIDEKVRVYVGADYWATDAISGVRLCEELITAAKPAP
jgi:methanogenic corrinoid protein MtbC1